MSADPSGASWLVVVALATAGWWLVARATERHRVASSRLARWPAAPLRAAGVALLAASAAAAFALEGPSFGALLAVAGATPAALLVACALAWLDGDEPPA